MGDSSSGGSFTTDSAAATVFEWNADKSTLAVADDSNNRAFGVGASSTYDNFSCYDLTGSYNWGQFEAVGGAVTPDTPVDPEPTHEHVACPTCGLCTAADCDGAEEVKCAGHEVTPEVPAHEHVACPTCGLCTAADCNGTVEEICAGHEATEEPAAPAEITITFVADNRVSQDSESQVWAVDGLKITNAKAESTQPIADYVNPARFYANTSLTFETTNSAKITKIVITTTGGKNFSASQTVEGATITVNGTTTTIVLDTPATSFTIAKLVAQARVSQMVVYTE